MRDPERARKQLGDAVDIAAGDFQDLTSLRAALDGVEQLVLSCADDPRRVAWETAAVDAAAAMDVRRIVKLSSIAAEPGAPVAFWDWHGRVEEHLRRSGLSAVVLRSSPYMSNVLAAAAQVAREGRIFAPAGAARIAMIDPRDVGAAAAAVLTGAGHDGRTYVLTGPEAITYAHVAAELAAATDREVEFVHLSDEDATRAMMEAGMPDAIAGQVVRLFGMLRAGAAEHVTPTVEALTGRAPRDFGTYARDHAALFTPMTVGATR